MKLACHERLLPGAAFADKVGRAVQYGYLGIELDGERITERVAEVKGALGNTGLAVAAIKGTTCGNLLSPDRDEREGAAGRIKEMLDAAAQLGAGGVSLVPSMVGKTLMPNLTPLATALDLETKLLTRVLDDIGRHAQKAGVYVLLEPVNRYETHYIKRIAEAAEICKRVGNPQIRITANTFHMNIEERDIQKILKKHKPWILHVHLADSNGYQPGIGHLNFRKALKVLASMEYKGYLSLDCMIYGRPDQELPKVRKYLQAFVDMYAD
jgi:sugar phosphate isomerase/epimerase